MTVITPLLISLAVGLLPLCSAFVWKLTDDLPAKKILTFSERYMFKSHDGPGILEQGDAYIKVDTKVTAYMRENISTEVAYAVYAAAEDHHHDSLEGMCGDSDLKNNYWATYLFSTRVPTVYVGESAPGDVIAGMNGTFHLWQADLRSKYDIQVEDWHNVAFQLCSSSTAGPIAKVDGDVTFRNPYGYIPGELYGFLPFEGARMCAYFLFGVFFFYRYLRFQESTVNLHKAVLVVFLFAVAESTCWYAAYQTINLTGQPYCCPFPATVVAALVLQIFRQSFARILLLIVSLGYGIVRPKLLPTEWFAIVIVSILYFTAACLAQVSEIILVHDIHGDAPDSVIQYQLPELVMDVVFLSWIYLALGSTVRILTEFQQTHKLLMYKRLAYTIAGFVLLFALVTLLILLDKSEYISWPWQWSWAQQVLWELLNFSVLSASILICLPSENSRLLSYASQLPTEDPDEDDEEGLQLKGGPGMPDQYSDEDDDYDDDGTMEMTKVGAGSSSWASSRSSKSSHFGSLPAAEDEEYGLHDND